MEKQTSVSVVDQKRVFVGIATGPAKDYAMHFMVAALRNLNWKNMEIHWAVTDFGNKESADYIERLHMLMETVQWNCPWHIHTTPYDLKRPPIYPVTEDGKIKAIFDWVIRNLRTLRGLFLDSECDYFLEVGGDNPPPRETVNRLLKLDADVAFGTSYQRPKHDSTKDTYPLVWLYSWQPSDLDKFNLEPELKKEFQMAYTDITFLMPLLGLKGWKRLKRLSPFAGGTGIVLIKRKVLERVGWILPYRGMFSEDVHFCNQCNLHGFKTVGDLKFHVPHLDEDGSAY